MKDELHKCFYDIVQACLEIDDFIQDMTYETFLDDLKTQKAVEREFEIIGEALNRIKRSDSELLEHISEHHKIIGFRNILAHGYDAVDELIVWQAVKNHLPILKSEVEEIIR
jgi:uncharacterized protein with HEPN domain